MSRIALVYLLCSCMVFGFLSAKSNGANVDRRIADTSEVIALSKRAATIYGDLVAASKASLAAHRGATNEYFCFDQLMFFAGDIAAELRLSTEIMLLYEAMEDQHDKSWALVSATKALNSLTQSVENRSGVNAAMAYCPGSVSVNVKGQTLLNLMEQIDINISPIRHRLSGTP